MRIPFCSLTFATQAAQRLGILLPALSCDQAKDWTAKVYGYADWAALESEVAKVQDPALLNLEPGAKYAVDAYQAGRWGNEGKDRTEFQIQKVEALLGWSRRAAEKLYITWEPRSYRAIRVDRLADLGPGSPAFQLMQTNIMEPFDSDAGVPPAVAGFNSGAGLVYLGFPGTAAERQAAVAGFLAKLPANTSAEERTALATSLAREMKAFPTVRPYGDEGTFAQVYPMTFFACRESTERELIGAGAVTFSFIASRDGSHLVKISVEHMALLRHAELSYAMSESIAVAVWEAIVRYLWCAVGDAKDQVRVVLEYVAGDVTATRCAVDAYELIIDCCGWPLDNEGKGANIHFEVEAKL